MRRLARGGCGVSVRGECGVNVTRLEHLLDRLLVVLGVGEPHTIARLQPPSQGVELRDRGQLLALKHQVGADDLDEVELRALQLVDDLLEGERFKVHAEAHLCDQHWAVNARVQQLKGSEGREKALLLARVLRDAGDVAAAVDHAHLDLEKHRRVARRRRVAHRLLAAA
eukprot:scaffold23627_cov121-Isochrysis_galbana.AAC.4